MGSEVSGELARIANFEYLSRAGGSRPEDEHFIEVAQRVQSMGNRYPDEVGQCKTNSQGGEREERCGQAHPRPSYP